MVDARSPAAAGVFYPAERGQLARTVHELLATARATEIPPAIQGRPLRAIVAAHSPYSSSGAVAASAWSRVHPATVGHVRRVVVLGPAHHVPLGGVAAPFADAFETPLGTVAVDRIAIEAARRFPRFVVSDGPHDQEHSIEAQLPFIQTVLEHAAIVPLLVGDDGDEDAAEILETLWDQATLVVVSTDLSHYFDAVTAQRLDESTARSVEALKPEGIGPQQACGASSLRALLRVAKSRGLTATRLALHHSGESSGEQAEVIGFGSFAITGRASR
ncbi:MAG TPA: AmmeMemoRadiSam system protein B [Polyangiaceae bacterium]|nr:AmmeMemoRadiSam system protein B [Polyangiaceae bacterium]